MSHSHLTLEERISIEIFVSMGLSCREMARRLGRSHSTLSRELRRNVGSAKRGYRAQSAERRARKRRKRPRHYRCMNRPELLAWVDEKLRANWSPEQIAGRIRLEYPKGSKHAYQYRDCLPPGPCSGTIRRYQLQPFTPRPQKAEAASQVWPGPAPVSRAY